MKDLERLESNANKLLRRLSCPDCDATGGPQRLSDMRGSCGRCRGTGLDPDYVAKWRQEIATNSVLA